MQRVIDHFDIPIEVAKPLSELLATQTVRERILTQIALEQPSKYEEFENRLIPIVQEIESYKALITKKYVPEKYNSDKYVWNYNGYEIDGIQVQILENI